MNGKIIDSDSDDYFIVSGREKQQLLEMSSQQHREEKSPVESDEGQYESSSSLIPNEEHKSGARSDIDSNEPSWKRSLMRPFRTVDDHPEDTQIQIPTLDTPAKFSFRKLWAFTGPGFLMCIAYLDPGNIESDLQQGAIAGYNLLWVLLWSTFLGFCLQSLSARLGAVTGRNLAEHCREQYTFWPRICLWLLIELAIIGSDIQEVIGSATAINLLSNKAIPIWFGVLITGLDTFTFLFLEMYNLRNLEAFFGFLVTTMAVSFWYMYIYIWPDPVDVIEGMIIPGCSNCTSEAGSQALGIVGAVIMPHNLYLHSALVLSRNIDRTNKASVKEANMYYAIESALALIVSFFINMAVVAVFAYQFFGQTDATLSSAGDMIHDEFGRAMAVIWGIGILASGQSSTMTGTYAGQFVMEGFLSIRWPRWKRVLLTRTIAMVPTLMLALFALADLESVSSWLNVLQSVLLPFAILPVIVFTSKRSIMDTFVSAVPIRLIFAVLSVGLVVINFALIYISIADYDFPVVVLVFISIVGVFYLLFICYISFGYIWIARRQAAALARQPVNAGDDD